MMRSRYAPTPSGFLHAGNLENFRRVRRWMDALGGEVFLRIDDMDGPRARPDYVAAIFEVLHREGLAWEIGPNSASELEAQWSQRLRLDRYREALLNWGGSKLLFLCSCSRKDKVCACRENGLSQRALEPALNQLLAGAAQRQFALKLRVDEGIQRVWYDEEMGAIKVDLTKQLGDFVIWRKDGIPAYQWVSLIDDVDYGITHIVRGQDLLSSTAAQLWLSELAGYSFDQVQFLHHPLVTDENGQKLSKSVLSFGT